MATSFPGFTGLWTKVVEMDVQWLLLQSYALVCCSTVKLWHATVMQRYSIMTTTASPYIFATEWYATEIADGSKQNACMHIQYIDARTSYSYGTTVGTKSQYMYSNKWFTVNYMS
jgi:hypothetical protein